LLHLINFDEPFGLSVVEAMACGTPVVASARGSMPELIQPGINGFLVHSLEEAAEAVKSCLGLNRNAVRASIIHRFSAERMVDDYMHLYAQIAGRSVANTFAAKSATSRL